MRADEADAMRERYAVPRSLRLGAICIALFNGLLFAWLLVKPGGSQLAVAIDDIAQSLGPLLAVPLCFVGGGGAWRRSWEAHTDPPPD